MWLLLPFQVCLSVILQFFCHKLLGNPWLPFTSLCKFWGLIQTILRRAFPSSAGICFCCHPFQCLHVTVVFSPWLSKVLQKSKMKWSVYHNTMATYKRALRQHLATRRSSFSGFHPLHSATFLQFSPRLLQSLVSRHSVSAEHVQSSLACYWSPVSLGLPPTILFVLRVSLSLLITSLLAKQGPTLGEQRSLSV